MRSRFDKEAWPPEPPKAFTPLVLFQHQGDRNLKHSVAMAEFVERGHIDKVVLKCSKLEKHEPLREVLETSKVTKEVAEILSPLETSEDPQFILIEGAPGIGKSVLLKEIAHLWGKKQVLQKFKLVLFICLRDPAAQQMLLIDDLFRLFCKRDKEAIEISSKCSQYFVGNNGEDLALLFDGYDEYPERLQKDSFIVDILERQVLPQCGLIVSSRPHASVSLRVQATVRVDILGFTEVEREHYIKESMKGQPHKINELMQYLQSHSTISSLCFIPFNIVVLVYLYKQGINLPKNSAELYNYFICLTVCRHLTKHGHHLQSNITNLTDIPVPYNKIIQQLSKLSLEALNNDKLIFTFDEIKEACPDITTIPGAINGFGLLQAVEHFHFTKTTMTFNFLHFSIQEFLAAHYITSLPADKELQIIEKHFWNDIHFNMFSIYITLTKGQKPSFKHFLSDGNKAIAISDKFLNNQLQCLCLYRFFHEAGDVNICKTIERSVTFGNRTVDLRNTTLTGTDVECVTLFLISSFPKWLRLDLYLCFIQDHGLRLLHHGLFYCSDITINKLWLEYNGLTTQSSPLISDITLKCKVKELRLTNNNIIGENEQLYSMLTNPSTTLLELYMSSTKLSSRGAITLFKALKNNNTLKTLYISANAITDDACDVITSTLEKNNHLNTLNMYSNPLTTEAIMHLVNGLKFNNTLALLAVPKCSECIKEKISSLQEVIYKRRKSQGFPVKLTIHYG